MRRYTTSLFSLTLVVLLVALAGCQNSTGQLFSPSSDIHVAGISPSVLQPTESSSDSGEESESVELTFPLLKVYFRIMNGVSVFVDQYTVRYYTPNGASVANGRYDVSGAVSAFIQAPEIKGFDSGSGDDSGGDDSSSGGSSGSDSSSSSDSTASIRAQDAGGSGDQQTIPEDVAGYTTLDIFSLALYSYMTRGNADATDDITPIVARITIHGRDLNDKEVSATAQITLSANILKESSN
ncbi:hypothetical protein KBA41_15130 [Candidatus Ozemobacteraceae bacterium]|nr:hypothetical protein [Candidatus Ozemobacteraceae bacterium]